MSSTNDARFGLVGKDKEDAIADLHRFYFEYIEHVVELAKLSFAAATLPDYKEHILYIMMSRAKRVYTSKPMTTIGLSGHAIANRVLPAVWEMTGGDSDWYMSFFENHVMPLGVRMEDFMSFNLSEQEVLRYADLKRKQEGRLC